MCSIITHPAVPLALTALLPRESITPGLVAAGVLCSIVPDFDVVGFRFGVGYGDMLGHRGFTHSIAFAVLLAAALTLVFFRHAEPRWWVAFLFLFSSTLSHPLLDMLTNGGLGVALLAPFAGERFFFPWRPIEVSPLGAGNFFSETGLRVLANELKLVWVPALVFFGTIHFLRKIL